jgi:hypothetical protein
MPMRRVHMEPFARRVRALPSRDLYYRSRDHPNAHELTNRIRHPSPESLPRILWMGMTYRIGFMLSSSYTTRDPTDSNHPTRNQDIIEIEIMAIICIIAIMHIIAIICIIEIITIFRIIKRFQSWKEGTIEGLGSSVGQSRSREHDQHSSMPYCLWWYNESTIIDARRPNNDGNHAMTSIEHFVRKRIAVNPLHSAHPCTWRVPAPNNWTVQNGLCVLPLLAAPMSERLWRRKVTCNNR